MEPQTKAPRGATIEVPQSEHGSGPMTGSALSASHRVSNALAALTVATTHTQRVMASVAAKSVRDDPTMDRVYEECANGLEFTAEHLEKLLSDFAGPIWGELPDDVRAVCRVAGM